MNTFHTFRKSLTAAVVLFVLTLWSPAIAANVANGESLFKQNCSACHKPDKKMVGPALKGVEAKYGGDKEWIYKWVKNSTALVKSGDARAVTVFNEFGKVAMTGFPNLKNEDIDDILAYVEDYKPPVDNKDNKDKEGNGGLMDPATVYAIAGLAGLLLLISGILVFVIATLAAAVRSKDESRPFTMDDVWATFTGFLKNKFVATCIALVVVVGGSIKLIDAARGVSLHQGYMPEQPIKYSHKLHAGENKIACQYCHSGASKSKQAWVPSSNVCMNCHMAIQEGPTYGREEISKIYAATKFNPETGKYFPDSAPLDSVKEALKKWVMGDTKSKNPVKAYEAVEKMIGKPVEWVRIHNLPDHAYFNHAQHVTVGQIQCQTCHGQIQEMEVVYQNAPLSMGWCIQCHRETKVKSLGSPTEYTVEDMGGLDCAKCHY